jgi:hypothetical protein
MPENTIRKIKLAGRLYDIDVPKDWNENDPDAIEYIKNRTHYSYQTTFTKESITSATFTLTNKYKLEEN